MNNLGKRVLDFDTDSVIYSCKEGEENVETGNSVFRDLTTELEECEWITKFCSTGPKSYAYRTNFENETVHINGYGFVIF